MIDRAGNEARSTKQFKTDGPEQIETKFTNSDKPNLATLPFRLSNPQRAGVQEREYGVSEECDLKDVYRDQWSCDEFSRQSESFPGTRSPASLEMRGSLQSSESRSELELSHVKKVKSRRCLLEGELLPFSILELHKKLLKSVQLPFSLNDPMDELDAVYLPQSISPFTVQIHLPTPRIRLNKVGENLVKAAGPLKSPLLDQANKKPIAVDKSDATSGQELPLRRKSSLAAEVLARERDSEQCDAELILADDVKRHVELLRTMPLPSYFKRLYETSLVLDQTISLFNRRKRPTIYESLKEPIENITRLYCYLRIS